MSAWLPGVRKLALTAHVMTSVGWLGAVASFLALAVAGLTGRGAATVRGAYLAMDLLAWWIILPLCLASLLTGVVQSLGTVWGLLRHWWVVIKLLMTVLATAVLIVHMRPISDVAGVAAAREFAAGDLRGVRTQLVVDAAAALVVLLVARTLSVYKPRGLTARGRRMQRELLRREARGEARLHTP